jgi:hypothetical protein
LEQPDPDGTQYVWRLSDWYGSEMGLVFTRADCRWAGSVRRDGVGKPADDQAGNLQIVLFQHDHVPVAVDAVIAEAQRGELDPGLRQILGGTMVVG